MGKKGSGSSGKVRFDGIDVAAMVSQLTRTLLGRRIINIYDAVTESGNDGYLVKLDGSASEEGGRIMLFMESGIRFHTTTQQAQQEGKMPSPFCMKLRKHLRGLRLERIVQLGHLDRVVDFVFGTGSNRHSLLLELYARGNILLCDSSYEILSLLRSHEYSSDEKEANVQVKVGNVYPVTYATSLVNADKQDNDDNADDKTHNGILDMSGADAKEWAMNQLVTKQEETATATTKKGKKKGESGLPLKALLLKPSSGVYHYGPSLLEHCILSADLDPNLKLPVDSSKLQESDWTRLVDVLRDEGSRVLQRLSKEDMGGFILFRPREVKEDDKEESQSQELKHADKVLEEFQPHLLKQHLGRPSIEYETFADAVDDFFFHIGGQKRALRAEAAEAAALERLNKVKQDQERRIVSLMQEQDKLKDEAQLVEFHAEDVDKTLSVINSALDSGMDWDALEQLVEVEQENENPIALLIVRLDFDNDAMILALPDTVTYATDKNGDIKKINVTVSLRESAHGNARDMFAKYRANKEKSQKTVEASTMALKAAEATAQRQLAEAQKKAKATASTQHRRKAHWWEKFHWFITSDNYLVLGGRDAQQNEMLVKRYLRPGDAYLHADVHGASSCILRAKRRRVPGNKTQVLPLSDQALREAGNFTICLSSAWTSRMVTSAWWVEPSQVSKTAPTGEYLTVGSFMVRGKKNFLPPSQLEMGLGVLFRLGDDDSIARHKNERRDFALMDNDLDFAEDDLAELSVQDGQFANSGTDGVDALNGITQMEKVTRPTGDTKNTDEALSGPAKGGDDEAIESKGVHPEESVEASQVESDVGPKNDASTAPDWIDDSEERVDEAEEMAPTKNVPKKKKGLSARDRKMIKKYGSLEAAEEAAKLREQEEAARAEKKGKKKAVTDESTKEKQTQGKRGKISKMRRAARKYDDQDEEDKELAMMALHGGEKIGKQKNGKQNKADASDTQKKADAEATALLLKDPSKVVDKLPQKVQDALAACVSVKVPGSTDEVVRWDKFDADILDQVVALETEEKQLAAAHRLLTLKQSTRVDNFSASLAGIVRTIQKYGHENLEIDVDTAGDGAKRKTKAEKEKEKEAWKEALAEEGIADKDEDGEDVVDDTAELSKLTGKPHNDDILLYAVPVCAPYYTLSQYKFKVKLAPGNLKRGKAAKQCMEMFLKGDNDKSGSSNRDKELVKQVVDNDWVQAICANVKISAAGARKATKKQKARKKNSKKK